MDDIYDLVVIGPARPGRSRPSSRAADLAATGVIGAISLAIVDETVLRRPVGGVEVMRDQLRHLVSQAALPSVCFQVVPVSVGVHQGVNGSFTVLGFAEPDEPEIATAICSTRHRSGM